MQSLMILTPDALQRSQLAILGDLLPISTEQRAASAFTVEVIRSSDDDFLEPEYAQHNFQIVRSLLRDSAVSQSFHGSTRRWW